MLVLVFHFTCIVLFSKVSAVGEPEVVLYTAKYSHGIMHFAGVLTRDILPLYSIYYPHIIIIIKQALFFVLLRLRTLF